MTKNILTLLILSTCFNIFGQEIKVSQDSLYHKDNGEKIYVKSQVDSIAKYQPSESEMYKFIATNINYPSDARENGIDGKVYISFIVEKDGSISDLIIIKGLIESCDNEVIRLFSSLPNKWTPALKNGLTVRSQYILPINFKLSGGKTKKKR